MSKVVYLIDQPLDERNYDRFGIQAWIDRGWDVEVWDLTSLAYPRVWQNYIESGRKLKEFEGHFPITSKSQLEHRYSSLARIGYFIDLTSDNYCSIRVKMRLIQMGAIRVTCAIGSIPEPGDGQKFGFVRKSKKAIAKGPIKSFKWLIDAFVRKVAAPFTKPGLVVVSGEKSIRSAGNDCGILKAHNLDYDIFLRLAESRSVLAGEYAVFIDQDYCFHSDFIYEGTPFFVTPERYFPAICNGLRKISDVLEVDLRIATHPRSSYQQRTPDYFEGIPVEYGRSAELIRNCKVVVCHDSTAIQFAVLYGKPIIFVITDELHSSPGGELIAKFASVFGKSVINLDGDLVKVDWRKELRVDSQKYTEYKNKYIKTDGSPEIPLWDIVINHIEKAERLTSTDLPAQCASAKVGG
ncbi:MAG: hypothetical protein Q7U07_06905 [Gammaproteobacteria bacterium]|nr:hypothetical protein [Gammaproteobacteria bacterium]